MQPKHTRKKEFLNMQSGEANSFSACLPGNTTSLTSPQEPTAPGLLLYLPNLLGQVTATASQTSLLLHVFFQKHTSAVQRTLSYHLPNLNI